MNTKDVIARLKLDFPGHSFSISKDKVILIDKRRLGKTWGTCWSPAPRDSWFIRLLVRLNIIDEPLNFSTEFIRLYSMEYFLYLEIYREIKTFLKDPVGKPKLTTRNANKSSKKR